MLQLLTLRLGSKRKLLIDKELNTFKKGCQKNDGGKFDEIKINQSLNRLICINRLFFIVETLHFQLQILLFLSAIMLEFTI